MRDVWGEYGRRKRLGIAIGLLIAVAAVAGTDPGMATAATPSLLWQSTEDGLAGSAAGRLGNPQAMAVNQDTGNIYVAEGGNARVSEFDPWGQFIRAWGWGVVDGSEEFQICTTSCQAGHLGAGPGQFDRSSFGGGIAIGPDGSVYVADPETFRVEKFDASGNFLLEWGEEGSGPGQFLYASYTNNLAVGPDGTVYWGEENRIQAFEPDGTFKDQILFEGELANLKDRIFLDLAVDEAGNLYATALGLEEIVKFNPAGELVAPNSFPLARPLGIAIDKFGNVFTTENFEKVVEFGPTASLVIPPTARFAQDAAASLPALATSNACGIEGSDLFTLATNGSSRSYIAAFGPPPDPNLCPQPVEAPTITRQVVTSIAPESAVVKAGINPHFWPDTTFYVEYGEGKCADDECTSRAPATDQLLTEEVVDKSVGTAGITLPDLEPLTEYHFRFVAESGGGGPVRAISEGSFTTVTDEGPPSPCANDAFRHGAAYLPNCRAYEMVSPVAKEGGEIFTLFNTLNENASLNQSSIAGDRVTYSSYRAFADPDSAPATSQYLATRGTSGWSTRAISPPRGTPHQLGTQTVETQFQAFSGDLCLAWLVHDTDPPLSPEAPETYPNLYKTNLCDQEEKYEALTTRAPSELEQLPTEYRVNPQGFSADATHTVFRASGKLTNNAAPGAGYQCYEHFEGQLRLVSILPNGQPNSGNCSIGAANSPESPHTAQLHNAISEDGSRIFWTAAPSGYQTVETGRIFLREHGVNPTQAVSQQGENLSNTASQSYFWTASPDGSKAVFSTGPLDEGKADAYEYRVADKSTHPIAGKVRGYLGSSEDASIIYLASEEARGGPNGEGKTATAGELNLYRYEVSGETFHFIGTLSDLDARTVSLSPLTLSPLANPVSRHVARVSADGRIAVFMSTAPLTGFDNSDANSGEPDAEVYRYDASANGGNGKLLCISCSPPGVAASGRELTFGSNGLVHLGIWAAARIPGWEAELAAPRVLINGGERVVFESYGALALRDTNGKQDVYQWSAVGAGGCDEASPKYSASNGGCISLISSGKSTLDAEFIDASADGRDIFFTTASSLVPQDPGLIDLYDAREGGGFDPPPPPKEACHEEACHSPSPAPADLTPASQQTGPGNPKPKTRGKCPKSKVFSKAKKRCVKKHSKHKKHNAKKSGRAGR